MREKCLLRRAKTGNTVSLSSSKKRQWWWREKRWKACESFLVWIRFQFNGFLKSQDSRRQLVNDFFVLADSPASLKWLQRNVTCLKSVLIRRWRESFHVFLATQRWDKRQQTVRHAMNFFIRRLANWKIIRNKTNYLKTSQATANEFVASICRLGWFWWFDTFICCL